VPRFAGKALPTLVWGFFCQVVFATLLTNGSLGVRGVDVARAEQAGTARPGRHASQLCAIGERRHPKGRSGAEQPAPAGLTTIADRATADGRHSALGIGCQHRFDKLPI